MTDQQLLIATLHEAGWVVAEYLEPGRPRDAEKTIQQLISILDRPDLAAAMERLDHAHGPAGCEVTD
jgi:hypothetical protein